MKHIKISTSILMLGIALTLFLATVAGVMIATNNKEALTTAKKEGLKYTVEIAYTNL